MEKTWIEIRKKMKEDGRLIHCITSPIAINDCANIVLALGAKPIMAEHPQEVAEITAIAGALTVSLANITDARLASMMISGETAAERRIPRVIDVVGVTCSKMRMQKAVQFIETCRPTVIKGNISEIRAMAGVDFENAGIDVSSRDVITADHPEALREFAEVLQAYARKTGAIIAATGAVDIIADAERYCFVYNGCEHMTKVTGTGCMLTCVLGACLASAESDAAAQFAAAVLAVVTMGVCGERADAEQGLASYHINLLDQISILSDETLLRQALIKTEGNI